MSNRQELLAPPEIFYDDSEARKYTSSSRIIDIQARLSERASELLALPADGIPRLLLDIVSTSESESLLQDLLDDEALILKNKSLEIEPYLNGRCLYLVGMMGSGKTTVGKILSQAIDYSFCDSDTLVEQDVGVTTVAEIFQIYGEDFFRNKETRALEKLSGVHRYVVSTGGGAVIRDENWTYMGKGISVWLDVPLEELARRIAAVGTRTRPLLVNEQGDAYTKAFRRLSALFEQRYKDYENASARVSLENIAAKLGYKDVSNITPAMIAIEAIEQIGHIL